MNEANRLLADSIDVCIYSPQLQVAQDSFCFKAPKKQCAILVSLYRIIFLGSLDKCTKILFDVSLKFMTNKKISKNTALPDFYPKLQNRRTNQNTRSSATHEIRRHGT
jgi:hypothetical protein